MSNSTGLTNGSLLSPLKRLLSQTNDSVRCLNIDKTCEKFRRLLKDGPKTLQIIADFDFTLSVYKCEDESRALSTHALFEENVEKLHDLLKKYLPIEYDRNLTVEEKIPHMLKWWQESHDFIVARGYDKESLKQLIKGATKLQLRKGAVEFLEVLEKLDVPLIIFSGGIGDVIELVIRENLGRLPHNVHIISNWMTYDEEGKVVGFRDTIVHSFNKNSSVIKAEERGFFEKLHHRPNVIVTGDSLGDAAMDVGLECEQTVLKVGYLNKDVEKFKQDFSTAFDLVCIEDNTFDTMLTIVKTICQI